MTRDDTRSFLPDLPRTRTGVPMVRDKKKKPSGKRVAPTSSAKPRDGLDENRYVAEQLNEMANLLEQQRASAFRVRAYREAATYVTAMTRPLRDIFEDAGSRGLDALPTIGASIASAIVEILGTGKLAAIDRLRGTLDPERLFQTVPMIGPELAKTIHDELSIDTLEALEAAAYDGRLAVVKGIGPRRLDTIKHSLSGILGRRRPVSRKTPEAQPPVADVLTVDRDYRAAAAADKLPTISPRRFNATGSVRLPILHTERGNWRFTAIFSNTPTAQTFKRTRDWVVIYYEHDGHDEGQCTVVTEHRGALIGRRVIRGREAACADHYRTKKDADAPT